MLRKRRIRSKDRLTITESVGIDETSDAATAEEWHALIGTDPGGFEWKLRDVEQQWQPYAPPAGATVEQHSPGWYAREIFLWVRRARVACAAQSTEQVGLCALQIGQLHEEGRWRLAVGGAAQYVRRVKANRLKAGRRRGRDVHAVATERDKRVIDLARQKRVENPRDATHSTRWLAGEIARRIHTPIETVRRRLRELGIK